MRQYLLIALLTAPAASLAAQGLCEPPTNSREANTFAILSTPVTFTGAIAPGPVHGVTIGLEAANLPYVDRADATPTVCQPGKGPENTNPIPGFVRPRVAVAVDGFLLEGSWIPPVTVSQVKANLFGFGIERPFALGNDWYLGLRADAVAGHVNAPVVCDDAARNDPSSECYRGGRSNDEWQPGLLGFEGTLSTGKGRFRPYVGAGYTALRPRLQVNFINAQGVNDGTLVSVNLSRAAFFGGVTWMMSRSSVTAEAYSTGDALAGRLVLRTALGR
ncbi:MAG TPA: hypothetical protein VHW65_05615 [Gemmatimonadales bacterium]|jgi:hypothetical protein|nr:hypothetical protein [Gemmatimonadales bacterium]